MAASQWRGNDCLHCWNSGLTSWVCPHLADRQHTLFSHFSFPSFYEDHMQTKSHCGDTLFPVSLSAKLDYVQKQFFYIISSCILNFSITRALLNNQYSNISQHLFSWYLYHIMKSLSNPSLKIQSHKWTLVHFIFILSISFLILMLWQLH